ncbi:Crp/Fnr family transcriptional regulator [Eggerthellaceae bacterium zg-1084]|uniref:Crp/Fnr family transcriptional regulator n=1 Tax=Berryella wangjianweii TaxID=2734634 RepID=A0A6M8J1M5_9ACTN|nr:cyclic nucleotide-binding domain-containing protein [Berryella wangjianweii]NPD31114.1 Crp/Fnr family transcriptional regulator [Berryella wangjianweii]NPD31976.1 Crp/Fnr family transcriptional regulator [Eggerthellaceae bacterium zg-997]QKF07434.1 Crp/Fnr family transcriptional regulator [Berryella wangjianweii]
MQVDAQILVRTPLFRGTTPEQAVSMLDCLGAQKRSYLKDERILRMGDVTESLGLVLKGSVCIESVDVWGNVSILGHVGLGRVFAETYAAVPNEPLMVDVVALEDTQVLFLNINRILTTCSSSCEHHARITRNLLAIFAQKNLGLSRRVFVSAPKTIRGKLLSFLSFESNYHGSAEFDIGFNRQELADYLGVDRSAMSAELGRMQREGILETSRCHFRLLDATVF